MVKVRRLLVVILIIVLLIGMIPLCRNGLLRELLIPGDPAVTVSAMETMVDNLKDGMPLQMAVEAFCMEILNNAPLS